MIKYSGSVSLDREAMAVLLELHLVNHSITITRLEISQVPSGVGAASWGWLGMCRSDKA